MEGRKENGMEGKRKGGGGGIGERAEGGSGCMGGRNKEGKEEEE